MNKIRKGKIVLMFICFATTVMMRFCDGVCSMIVKKMTLTLIQTQTQPHKSPNAFRSVSIQPDILIFPANQRSLTDFYQFKKNLRAYIGVIVIA